MPKQVTLIHPDRTDEIKCNPATAKVHALAGWKPKPTKKAGTKSDPKSEED